MQVEVLYIAGHPYALLIEAYMDWLRENGHEVIPGEVGAWGSSRVRGNTDLLVYQDSGASSGFLPSLSTDKNSILLGAPFFSFADDQRISAMLVRGDSMKPMADYLSSADLPIHELAKRVKIETIKVDADAPMLVLEVPTPAASDWTSDLLATIDRPFKVRRHPISATPAEVKTRMPLTDAIKAASLTICHTSTALSECVRIGAPFICGDTCLYGPMSGAVQSERDRRRFINNLLSCDFGWHDIRSGRFHDQIMRMI